MVIIPQNMLTIADSAWWTLLFLWPVWGFVLWRFGWKRKASAAIPMVIGLVIMLPVLAMLIIGLSFQMGAHL